MKREIVITSKEDRKQLAEFLRLDKTVISKAMNFASNSMAARKARIFAVNKLGCRIYLNQNHLI